MNCKIFADVIEQEAIKQVSDISNLEAFADTKIRIMPDVHVGTSCIIGFTKNKQERCRIFSSAYELLKKF